MTTAQLLTLVGIGCTLVGGILGYGIKYYFDKKQYYLTKNAEFKRQAYSELISLLLRILSQDKLGKMSNKTITKLLNSAYEKCILYASPEVINSFGDTMQTSFLNCNDKSKEHTRKLLSRMTRLYISMRKDVGLKNNDLGEDGIKIMRVKTSDYYDYFEEDMKDKMK